MMSAGCVAPVGLVGAYWRRQSRPSPDQARRLRPRSRCGGRARRARPRTELTLLARPRTELTLLARPRTELTLRARPRARPAPCVRAAWGGVAVCERVKRRVRPVAHGVLRDTEQLGYLAVALAAVEHERKHSALVGWQSVELSHVEKRPGPLSDTKRSPVGYRGRPMAIPPAAQINEILLGFDRLYGLELLGVLGDRRARPGGSFATITSNRQDSCTVAYTPRSPSRSPRSRPA